MHLVRDLSTQSHIFNDYPRVGLEYTDLVMYKLASL
jgi:hypothetical protein